MTENTDAGAGPTNRIAPKRGRVELADLVFMGVQEQIRPIRR